MPTYYWHIHHNVIAEPTENIEERKEYMRSWKPKGEVETRLRLMIPVKDQDSVRRAYDEYDAIRDKTYEKYKAIKGKAWEEYETIRDKAWEDYIAIEGKAYEKYKAIKGKAWEEYDAIRDKAWKEYIASNYKAWEDYNAKLWDLHKKEHPGCPWNGKTIFPEKEVQ